MVDYIFGIPLAGFQVKEIIFRGIFLEIVLRFFKLLFQIQHLLREPLGGLLRGVPTRFEVFIYVVRSEGVQDTGCQNRILRIKTKLDRAAAPDWFDVQAIFEARHNAFLNGRVFPADARVGRKATRGRAPVCDPRPFPPLRTKFRDLVET